MKEITVAQAQRMSEPCPFALLGTKSAAGKENFMAVSWWTYLSNHPPMLGVCLSNKGYSGSIIKKQGEFSLNMVALELSSAALNCGRCSGRDIDKIKAFEIETMSAERISAPLVKNSRICFECRLLSAHEAGDHTFYMAEILKIHADEDKKQLFGFEGYRRLDTV